MDLKQGDYLLIDNTKAPKVVGRFSVGSGTNAATAPTPDATVTLRDFRFSGSSTLPSTGVVRATNMGRSPHFIAMVRVASAAAGKKVVTYLRMGQDKKAEKYVKGELELLSLVSPGVSNDVSVKGLKPGTYVIACFYGDARSKGKEHSMLGMERVVTVK